MLINHFNFIYHVKKLSLFFVASFFSVFLKFNYSQEIKYVFHDKNNLIPYTIKNDHLKNIPLESKVLKNISTEVKYVKLNRTPTKDFVKNALSNVASLGIRFANVFKKLVSKESIESSISPSLLKLFETVVRSLF